MSVLIMLEELQKAAGEHEVLETRVDLRALWKMDGERRRKHEGEEDYILGLDAILAYSLACITRVQNNRIEYG